MTALETSWCISECIFSLGEVSLARQRSLPTDVSGDIKFTTLGGNNSGEKEALLKQCKYFYVFKEFDVGLFAEVFSAVPTLNLDSFLSTNLFKLLFRYYFFIPFCIYSTVFQYSVIS